MIGKNHLLKLALISIAAVTVGAVIGLILNYQTIKEIREGPKAPTTSSNQSEEEKPSEKIATFSGKIKPAGPSIYMQGTHYLEGEDGETIVLLKSSKIDLSFIEGQNVEVEGKVEDTVEGDEQILEVEKVRF